MTTIDPVRELLTQRKVADHVARGGLEALVGEWEATVRSAQKGYTRDLDDWRNEVDARDIAADAMEVAHPALKKSMKLRLDAADAKFWKACQSSAVCVWGAAQAEREKWTAAKEWWYFLVPKKAGDALKSDLVKLDSAKPDAGKSSKKTGTQAGT
jgi:hypothetical protein